MKPGSTAGIFISYRRDDTKDIAYRLCEALEKHFGDSPVFMDKDIQGGQNFGEVLEQRVSSSRVVIALIGEHWLTVTDAQGRLRLGDPKDWVFREIKTALDKDIPVIPLLVSGTTMPKTDQLPAALAPLCDCQAVGIDGANFYYHLKKLTKRLEEIVFPWKKWAKRLALAVSVCLVAWLVYLWAPWDYLVSRRVSGVISKNPMTKTLAIDIRCIKGVVVLSGEFDTRDQSNAIVRLAQGVPGVKQVNSRSLRWSDAAITKSVDEVLAHSPHTSGGNIHVETHNSVVFLTGTAKELQASWAGELAKHVEGVKDVKNEVKY